MAERGGDQIHYGSGKPEGILPLSERTRKQVELGMALIMFGQLVLTGCQKGIDPADTMGPEQPGITQTWTPSPEEDPFLTPTEYMIPGISTETASAPTPAIVETPPPQIEGGALFLPGVSLGAGGPELQNIALSAVQSAVNAAGFGIVGSEGSAGAKTGNMCISIVPEQLNNSNLPEGVEHLNQEKSADGVAVYDETQVLMQVPLPQDTDEATYACALGYARNNNTEYEDGTLRQLLIETTAEGSKVIASMQAGFSTSEDVAVLNGTVYVDGQTQGWDVVDGEQIPSNWSLEIPATPEECTNVIPGFESGKMEQAIKELNQKILEESWFPDGNIPKYSVVKNANFNPFLNTDIAIFQYTPYDNKSLLLYSCSQYGENHVFGATFFIPNGPAIPIQVLSDIELKQVLKASLGKEYIDEQHNPSKNVLAWYEAAKNVPNFETLSLYYNDQFPEEMQQTATGALLQYLDEKYDYSKRIQDLITQYGADPIRDQETIDLLQTIVVPGSLAIIASD